MVLVLSTALLSLLDFAQPWFSGTFGSHSYGRFSDHWTIVSYAPTMNNKLGWILMECPSVLAFCWFYFQGENAYEPLPIFFFLIWMSHYFQRSFIYPIFILKTAPGRKQNLAIVLAGMLFNTINSYLNATNIASMGTYPVEYIYEFRFVLGLTIFLLGYYINKRSDQMLAALRSDPDFKYKKGDPDVYVDKSGSMYRLPRGFLFDYVSSPNYFGMFFSMRIPLFLLLSSLPLFSLLHAHIHINLGEWIG